MRNKDGKGFCPHLYLVQGDYSNLFDEEIEDGLL
jgi:hypothetical protein